MRAAGGKQGANKQNMPEPFEHAGTLSRSEGDASKIVAALNHAQQSLSALSVFTEHATRFRQDFAFNRSRISINNF
jgi:hypothetical protein